MRHYQAQKGDDKITLYVNHKEQAQLVAKRIFALHYPRAKGPITIKHIPRKGGRNE